MTGIVEGQEKASIVEAAQMWNKLNARYTTMELTYLLRGFVRDTDFKAVIAKGISALEKQAAELEAMLRKYAVAPMPAKPPIEKYAIRPLDGITDRYTFRRIFAGIQSFLPIHELAFQQSRTPQIRKKFKELLAEEIDIYDAFFMYGQLKGWIARPPSLNG